MKIKLTTRWDNLPWHAWAHTAAGNIQGISSLKIRKKINFSEAGSLHARLDAQWDFFSFSYFLTEGEICADASPLCFCFLKICPVKKNCEKKSLSRLLVTQVGRQILKVKSSLLPFPPFLLKDPIGRYCQRGNSDDDMFPVLPCQAVWSQSAEWANFEMCFSAHWELAALACGVCDI